MRFIYLFGCIFPSLFFACQSPTIRMPGYEVHGIDISHHQQFINWDTVACQSIDFAFVKATEGITWKDSLFEHNWQELKRVGIKRGAYHFFHPNLSAEQQANHFIRVVDLQAGDLPPVIDFEISGGTDKQLIQKRLRKWLNLVENHFDVRPVIYTNQKLYLQFIAHHFDQYPIWMARYNDEPPLMAAGRKWTFWQYGNRGQLKGVTGAVDFNVFHGTLMQLEQIALPQSTAVSYNGLVAY